MNTYYFDNGATTALKQEVIDEMIPYFNEVYGNPSSIYALSRNAKKAIENAREQIANLICADKQEIYFTSGGTEADNMAIRGTMEINKVKNHIITTKIEHPAILNTCKFLEQKGVEVTYLNVDEKGFINLKELKNSIKENTGIISIMFANNEIGTIEPVVEIGKIAKEKNIIFHTDGVQAVGNIEIDVNKMGIDMLSISSHKIYGPKGIGALYIKKGINIQKIIFGGAQEKNLRAGTENVPGIIGFGKAAELINNNLNKHIIKLKELRDYYINEIKKRIPRIKINGSIEKRLPGNANISFEGIDSTSLILELDNYGICASGGSACSSKEKKPSHVLSAIGVSEKFINGALRTTFGDFNNKREVDYLLNNLEKIISKLRNINNEGIL